MADAAPAKPRRKGLALHWQIIIGLVAGIVVGLIINLGWTSGTWTSMGVDHVPAFLDKDASAMVPVTGLGSESLEAIPNQDTIRALAENADRPDLADRKPLSLTEAEANAIGLDMKPANEDANVLAHTARFIRNANLFVGDLFMRSLRFIAVPIVLFSLIVGVSTLNNLTKLSRIGGKTIAIYLVTTAVAISLGLVIANLARPGSFVPQETRDRLLSDYQDAAQGGVARAAAAEGMSAWERIVDLIAANPFAAIAEGNMLQIVMLALLIGIGLSLILPSEAKPVVDFCDGMTKAVIKLVELLMLTAPIAVFALIVKVIADLGLEVLGALAVYSLCVVGGLALMVFVVYPIVLKVFTGVGPARFYKAIAPAQLLAFSSASSSATLPVTMECVEKRLGVNDEVSSFVLPLGATINMDGTALYQGVAAVFIAQLYSMNLGIGDQLAIVGTATLASIGTAGVPGAGVIMLVIVLQSVGVPLEGIAAILGVDRLLDMCRTTCNVTGDAMVATVVAGTEGELAGVEEVERRLGVDESPGN
ncbi:MAG: dicarboxylate/amino acid:cation symporter [Phycisphaera sp.]|nr:MAG: dicarboxylate/amino acid:cation symporter [Phycisphaera sp.]